MLSKKNRLSRNEFDLFFRVGKRSRFTAFELVSAPHTGFHVAVVVPKKVASGAVVRNRVRRKIYGIVRRVGLERGARGAFILIARPLARTTTTMALSADVERAFAEPKHNV